MLHLSIEVIDKDIRNLSEKGIEIGETAKEILASGGVLTVSALIPNGLVELAGIQAVLTKAIAALHALHDLADNAGFNGRLLTLATEITALEHAAHHTWGDLVHIVQLVFNHSKKK
jgi:hypothetical protein